MLTTTSATVFKKRASMDKREGHGGDDETVRKNQSRQSKTERDMTAALQFIILLFLFSLHLIVTQNNIRSNPISRSKDVEALVELLFPNRTAESSSDSRRLQVEKVPYNASNPVPCVICRGLKKCTILNGFLVQETYYPKNLNYRETCKVIDKFGARIEELVFGNGKTFRDTPQCRGNFWINRTCSNLLTSYWCVI